MQLETITCEHKYKGECKDSNINLSCKFICSDYQEMILPTTEVRKDVPVLYTLKDPTF